MVYFPPLCKIFKYAETRRGHRGNLRQKLLSTDRVLTETGTERRGGVVVLLAYYIIHLKKIRKMVR